MASWSARRLDRRALSRRTAHWLPLGPALALLIVVLGIPLIENFYRSISEPGWTYRNYTAIFDSGVTLQILWRTLETALIVTVIALVLGYPYAYLMTRAGDRGRAVLLAVVLIPFWTSALARNFAWIILLGNGGPVQKLVQLFGFSNAVLYGTSAGVMLAMSQVMLPFMVLPLYAAFGGIDRRLLLAARGLGSSPAAAFWKVYWPLSRRGVVSGVILVFTLTCGFYVTPALVGSPQDSLVSQLLAEETTQLLNFAAAGALGTFVLVVTLALVAWANRVAGTAGLAAPAARRRPVARREQA